MMNESKCHLIVTTNNFPFGGGETFFETEINYLSKSFDQITIISLNTESEFVRPYPDNITVRRFDYHLRANEKVKALFQIFTGTFWKEVAIILFRYKIFPNAGVFSILLSTLYKRRKVAREIHHAINHVGIPYVLLYAYWANDMAIGMCSIKNVNKVCRAHAGDVYFEVNKYNYLPLRDYLFRKMNNVYFISDYAKSYSELITSKKYLGFKVARLGVDSQPRKKRHTNRFLRIVSCSFLKPVKRVHLIVHALGELSDLNIEWHHFGGGPLQETIEELVSSRLENKKNIVAILHGNTPNHQVLKYFQQNNVDLFVNVSASEGVPVSIMEAFSAGIPALATNVGGVAEIVNEGNGFLINKNCTPDDIAKVLKQFARLSESKRNQLSDNAYKIWKDRYNAEKNYAVFAEHIRSL